MYSEKSIGAVQHSFSAERWHAIEKHGCERNSQPEDTRVIRVRSGFIALCSLRPRWSFMSVKAGMESADEKLFQEHLRVLSPRFRRREVCHACGQPRLPIHSGLSRSGRSHSPSAVSAYRLAGPSSRRWMKPRVTRSCRRCVSTMSLSIGTRLRSSA